MNNSIRVAVLSWLLIFVSSQAEANAPQSIEGTWKQGGMTWPLTIKKTDQAPKAHRPQEPKSPYPYKEEQVTYVNGKAGISLAGTLTWPMAEGRYPAVLLISGSGPQDRDEALFGHRPFLVLADTLTQQGIAVLRVDDRGVGGSTGDRSLATTEDYAEDALAGVEYLKSRPQIDPNRIGLIGHSEGGLIVPMIATQRASLEQLFIVLQDPNEVTLRQKVQDLLQGQGVPPEILAAEVDKATSPWYRFFVGHDPRPTLMKVTNHTFQTAKTGLLTESSVIEETISPTALDTITQWIASHLKTD